MENWWQTLSGQNLLQGDFLKDCPVPVLPQDFVPKEGTTASFKIEIRDLIVMTQSCDLETGRAPFVAMCPVYSLEDLSQVNPKFQKNDEKDKIRKGQYEGLHMLAAFDGPSNNTGSLVVDFREIYSLPIGFLKTHAEKTGARKRLMSPYLEHLAQSFARFFMRVGLPSQIESFIPKKVKK